MIKNSFKEAFSILPGIAGGLTMELKNRQEKYKTEIRRSSNMLCFYAGGKNGN